MTRLFLSSLEVNRKYVEKQAYKNSKYILLSYYYLRKIMHNDSDFAQIVKQYNSQGKLILDSGAFSFMNGKVIEEAKMDIYCEQYIEFIKKYNIKNYVELDVDSLFGYEKALYYRKHLEKEIGYKCIPIWHKSRGKQAFIKMCKEYDYAGIGGIAIGNIKKSEWKHFKTLTDYAKSHNCKLHGMGFTPTHDLNKFGFHSVDSSSWIKTIRFGTMDKFDGHGIKTIKRKEGKRFNSKMRKRALTMNWNEWCKYQRYVDKG